MIQFAYESQQVRARSGTGVDLVYRPKARIRIDGPKGTDELSALVDTGADETLLPVDLAERLGLELRDEARTVILGIVGNSTPIWYAQVNLEVLRPGGGPRWSARVGFYLGAKPILGHAGFLDHFTAKFNGRAKTLTLTPNGTTPDAIRFEAESV